MIPTTMSVSTSVMPRRGCRLVMAKPPGCVADEIDHPWSRFAARSCHSLTTKRRPRTATFRTIQAHPDQRRGSRQLVSQMPSSESHRQFLTSTQGQITGQSCTSSASVETTKAASSHRDWGAGVSREVMVRGPVQGGPCYLSLVEPLSSGSVGVSRVQSHS